MSFHSVIRFPVIFTIVRVVDVVYSTSLDIFINFVWYRHCPGVSHFASMDYRVSQELVCLLKKKK